MKQRQYRDDSETPRLNQGSKKIQLKDKAGEDYES